MSTAASTAAAETPAASTAISPDLTKAREAYDRAGTYKSQSGGLDLTDTNMAAPLLANTRAACSPV